MSALQRRPGRRERPAAGKGKGKGPAAQIPVTLAHDSPSASPPAPGWRLREATPPPGGA